MDKKKNGIEIFKKLLDQAYEPIEEFRVGKVMDDFIYRFYRKRDQDMSVYKHAWEKEILRVSEVVGELNARWKTHLWLSKSGLNHDQRTKLLVATLGKFDLEQMMSQSVRIFLDVKAISSGGRKCVE